jgi:hypothetical protein
MAMEEMMLGPLELLEMEMEIELALELAIELPREIVAELGMAMPAMDDSPEENLMDRSPKERLDDESKWARGSKSL